MYEQDLIEIIEKVKKSKSEFQNVELKKCKERARISLSSSDKQA